MYLTKMHGRHRNIGNGYRSGSMEIGMPASRISPDRSMRSQGYYGSDQRGFNRGYGRGRAYPKSYQNRPPPPTPPLQRKGGGDIFMEAGRLAAEYLVSQGVLPSTVLSGKWQNDNFRKQAGEIQGFRSQETQMGMFSPGVNKRMFVDDYSSTGSRSYMEGRRSNRYGSDFGRSGSWSERNRTSEVKAYDDSESGHLEEQPLAEDNASSFQRSNSGDFPRKHEGAGDSESDLNKYNLQDEAQSKTCSSSAGKDIVHGEISKVSEDSSSLSAGSGELKGRNGDGRENENQTGLEGWSIRQHEATDEVSIKNGFDLVTLCKFAKVPTRTRSSLTAKGPKHDLSENIKGSSCNSGLAEENQIPRLCESPVQSSGKADNPECAGNENLNPTNPVGDMGHAHMAEKSKCHRSSSFPDSILMNKITNNSGLELADLHRSHSMGKERDEKRAAEDCDLEKGAKRQREWQPSIASEAKASEIKSDPEEERTCIFEEKVVDSAMKGIACGRLVDNSAHNQIQVGKSCGGYAEERHLFPGSFKICDLNLEGASDVKDNNVGNPMILFPAISASKRESPQVDFDLSISSCSKSLEHTLRMSNGKEIEVIDLENDSPEVTETCGNSERKLNAAYAGFSRQTQAASEIHNEMPDYNEGLMMVEFLDSFGNIPPVNAEITEVTDGISSHSHMPDNETGLQNSEGTHGSDQAPLPQSDDDSIFMSLGEIPLTFLQAWDHPPARGYGKPF
ncbi:PREDICTED: uncharacterized protein At4g26450-like [Tarenaya hassleriana]|uniref:uncharacterized protein At4g26450-like n=1 Tax=Tarenaya hassleriana TaxID=28532 RepID=UPI00053C8456|nr:PREDICTED: uncharacterized protein At4g26450-like [Tarenaya hassleriana]